MMAAKHIRRIPALDGLRGVAIILVIFWHYCSPSWLPGWSGVELFFVLSGYLITGNLLASLGQPGYFGNFYRNRVLRILPLYYIVLTGFFLTIHFLVQKKNLPTLSFYTGHWKSFFFFTQNWDLVLYGEPENKIMTHTWSLAIEEQFYLIWPIFLFLIYSAKQRIRVFVALLILIFVSRTLSFLYLSPNGDVYYFNTFFRMDSLIIGSLLYQIHRSGIEIPARALTWGIFLLTLSLILGCTWTKDVSGTSMFFGTVGYTVIALWYALLLHISVKLPLTRFTRALNWPALRYCGKISYGLYLFHVPVLYFVGYRFYYWAVGQWPDKSGLFHTCSTVLSVLSTFLVSTLSYRYIESYFLRLKK